MFLRNNFATGRRSKISLIYTHWLVPGPSFYSGKNTLYCKRNGNSYVLLDIQSLQKTSSNVKIVTNNKDIFGKNKNNGFIWSDKAVPNEKFIISKYLTSVFQSLPIKKLIRDKFYCRIRKLLLDKLIAVRNRLNNKLNNNRETSTYIKFSYRYTTWFLEYFIPCTICKNTCAQVMLNNRFFCGSCSKNQIVTPEVHNRCNDNSCNWSYPFLKFGKKKRISQRLGWSYDKEVIIKKVKSDNYNIIYSNLQTIPNSNKRRDTTMKKRRSRQYAKWNLAKDTVEFKEVYRRKCSIHKSKFDSFRHAKNKEDKSDNAVSNDTVPVSKKNKKKKNNKSLAMILQKEP